MKKKILTVIMLVGLLCVILTACGGSNAELKGAYASNIPSEADEINPEYKWLIAVFELTNDGEPIDMTGENSATVEVGGEEVTSLTSSGSLVANYYTYSGYSEIKVIPDTGDSYASFSKTTYSDVFESDETRVFAAVFGVQSDLITDEPIKMSYTIGNLSGSIDLEGIENITLVDETMKWEDDFETAQMARSYIWRLNSLSLMNTELRSMALEGKLQYTGNNFNGMADKLKALLATNVDYGISYSEEPHWGLSSYDHPSETLASESLPVLDFDVIESVYPGTKAINERLYKNAVIMAETIRTHGSIVTFTDACIAISDDLRLLDDLIEEEIYMLSE